jgi:hypothetical protein
MKGAPLRTEGTPRRNLTLHVQDTDGSNDEQPTRGCPFALSSADPSGSDEPRAYTGPCRQSSSVATNLGTRKFAAVVTRERRHTIGHDNIGRTDGRCVNSGLLKRRLQSLRLRQCSLLSRRMSEFSELTSTVLVTKGPRHVEHRSYKIDFPSEHDRAPTKSVNSLPPRVEAGKNTSTVIPASRKRRRKGNRINLR